MQEAKKTFIECIDSTRRLFSIYDFLSERIHLSPNEILDVLRSQIVYSVSALDRFIHEIVRIGLLEIFDDRRVCTSKFKAQSFSAQSVKHIMRSLKANKSPITSDDLPENILNKEISHKLITFSFQSPEKIKDALSYIWTEPQKMAVLADKMNVEGNLINDKQKFLEQQLELIVERRNQIVHESDFNPVTGERRNITRDEVKENIDFIERLGMAIFDEITSPSCYKKRILR